MNHTKNNMSEIKYSPELIAQALLNAEKKDGLFDYHVDGLHLYQHIRIWLYYEICNKLKIFDQIKQQKTLTRYKEIKAILKHSLMQNDLWGIKESSIAFVENMRYDSKEKQNIYTFPLLEEFKHSHCVIRRSYNDGEYRKIEGYSKNRIYYDYYVAKRKLLRIALSKTNKSILFDSIAEVVCESMNNHLAVSIDLTRFISDYMISSYLSVQIALDFLGQVKPSLLIVVCSYVHSDIVHAAKNLKIPVIELQHGVIYPFHLGYSYPRSQLGTVDIFPDYFFTYGEYWNNIAPFPIKKKNIIATGFPYFERQVLKNRRISDESNTLLFISQNTIGLELFKIAIDVAKRVTTQDVIFKLHPKQYHNWTESYSSLIEDGIPSNLSVLGVESPPIYELFAISKIQIGVFSTAIYEGLGFGLKTIICMLPGWTYCENLIKKDYAKLARNSDEVIELIPSNRNTSFSASKMFRRNSVENMQKMIDQILMKHNS